MHKKMGDKMIFTKIRKMWIWLRAQSIVTIHYDKKYIRGKYFEGGIMV